MARRGPRRLCCHRYGCAPRQAARTLFRKAVDKLEASRPLNLKEWEAVKVLGFSMMWQFAFDDRELVTDLCDLLVAEGSL